MKNGLLVLGFLTAISCYPQQRTALKLWYNTVSGTTWENALPIGNGRLGAMVYGNVDTETCPVERTHIMEWRSQPQ